MRRTAGLILIAGAVLVLSGCVWLRLLEVKTQFADFDRFIEVPPGPQLSLRFRTPVVLIEDVDRLLKAGPTFSMETAAGGVVRAYSFLHLPGDDGYTRSPLTPGEVLVLVLAFDAQRRLTALTYPPEATTLVPKPLAIAMMRALGSARIDIGSRSATGGVMASVGVPPPTLTEIEATLGRANREQQQEDGKRRLVWRYRLESDAQREPVVAALAVLIAPDQERISAVQVNISGLWMTLNMPKQP